MIRGDDNLVSDINSFISYIVNELIDLGIKIKVPTEKNFPNPTNNFFVEQINIEKKDSIYSLRFVFNKRGLFSFGLFSLYEKYPGESSISKYSLKRIFLEGEISPETFFEKFFQKITNQLI